MTSEGGSTQRATEAAVPTQETRDLSEATQRGHDHEFPSLGERDGRFYVFRHIIGTAEIPDKVHDDNGHEVRIMATNAGWLVTDEADLQVDQAAQTPAGWDVTYSVPVEPNNIGE